MELIKLRDKAEVDNWISSFPSVSYAPSNISEYANIYSFITDFSITKDEAETALNYYLDNNLISHEQLNLICSGDKELITKTFASKYSIVVGECIYCPNWVYTHSAEEYNNVGITIEDITAKSDLYADFGFTNEARNAFENKLSNYTGTAINLNIPVLANTDNISEEVPTEDVLIEDVLIIEDDSVDIIVEEPAE